MKRQVQGRHEYKQRRCNFIKQTLGDDITGYQKYNDEKYPVPTYENRITAADNKSGIVEVRPKRPMKHESACSGPDENECFLSYFIKQKHIAGNIRNEINVTVEDTPRGKEDINSYKKDYNKSGEIISYIAFGHCTSIIPVGLPSCWVSSR